MYAKELPRTNWLVMANKYVSSFISFCRWTFLFFSLLFFVVPWVCVCLFVHCYEKRVSERFSCAALKTTRLYAERIRGYGCWDRSAENEWHHKRTERENRQAAKKYTYYMRSFRIHKACRRHLFPSPISTLFAALPGDHFVLYFVVMTWMPFVISFFFRSVSLWLLSSYCQLWLVDCRCWFGWKWSEHEFRKVND